MKKRKVLYVILSLIILAGAFQSYNIYSRYTDQKRIFDYALNNACADAANMFLYKTYDDDFIKSLHYFAAYATLDDDEEWSTTADRLLHFTDIDTFEKLEDTDFLYISDFLGRMKSSTPPAMEERLEFYSRLHSIYEKNIEDNAYKYPITPDSEDWGKYTPAELYRLLNIPEDSLKEMDTECLLTAVLDYPYIGNVMAFNSYDLGVQKVSQIFSGLRELINRSDASDILHNEYLLLSDNVASNSVDSADFDRMKYLTMNALLSAECFYDKLDNDQIDNIKQASRIISQAMDTTAIEDLSTPYASSEVNVLSDMIP